MDTQVSYVHQQNKSYSLTFRENFSPEEANPIYRISSLASEIFAQIGHLPICEVRQLPNWDQAVHFVMDPEAQKLIQSFHRYGLEKPLPNQVCPFKDGPLRDRFTTLIGQDNVMTVYEEQSKEFRSVLIAYFKHQKLEALKVEWKVITKEWLSRQIKQDVVHLFDASLALIGECLIKGILGYKDCSEADIIFNREFWKNLFKLSSQEMKPLKELEAEGPPQPTIMGKILEVPLSVFSSLAQTAYMYCALTMLQFHALAQKIYTSTVGDANSLCYYLANQGWNEPKIVENIKVFLAGGQETVGYMLGYLLYAYAGNREMQDEHAQDKEKIKMAFWETLRLYNLSGPMRDARCDMVLSYPAADGSINKHFIKKGDRIFSSYLWGHDPKQWSNPEQFNCNRPLLEKVKEYPHFGSGPHRCIGEKTAQQELMTVVGEILLHARWTTKDKMPELIDSFTFRPLHDIKVHFEPVFNQSG